MKSLKLFFRQLSGCQARHLMGQLLSRLKALGWEVAAALDVSRRLQDKTVFILRQCPPEQQHFAVLSL